MNEISREAKELVENVSDVIEPVEPTTNCSKLGSKFAIKQVGKSEGYVIYRENEFIGGITFGNDKDVYVVATRLSPSELRGLADLVEDTLGGGE